MDSLILKLHDVEAVKFDKHKLECGMLAPIYIDLRVLESHPKLMNEVSTLINQKVEARRLQFGSVCGVPYTALPLATIICSKHKLPMLTRRKKAKDYGTERIVEGVCRTCLIIEDIVTTGSSILETAKVRKKKGLKVTDAIVFIDGEQGGRKMLASEGIKLHPVLSMSKLLDVLRKAKRIDKEMAQRARKFILGNGTFRPKKERRRFEKNLDDSVSKNRRIEDKVDNCCAERANDVSAPKKPRIEDKVDNCCAERANDVSAPKKPRIEDKVEISYAERANLPKIHPLASQLLNIMEEKQSNLCLSADVTSSKELLELAKSLGPKICLLKTHVDILEDYTMDVGKDLQALAKQHNFLIFEDRKFADIGNTVMHQYKGGVFQISSWSDIVNIHAVPGPGVVQGLSAVGKPLGRGCLLIAQMSSKGSLATGEYTQAVLKMAEEYSDFVIGFICCTKITNRPEFIHMTPGVQMKTGEDALGQQYSTPEEVINKGSDVIIVGRGILMAPDKLKAAELYKQSGWNAYEQRLALSRE